MVITQDDIDLIESHFPSSYGNKYFVLYWKPVKTVQPTILVKVFHEFSSVGHYFTHPLWLFPIEFTLTSVNQSIVAWVVQGLTFI